jgi:hypothetical protein
MKTLTQTDLLDSLTCSATFSDDECYRYTLVWRWDDRPLLIAWLLNPSTATHEKLDPTVAGVMKRARAWGYGGVGVINLFAIRATDPRDMLKASDPVGPDNDRMIRHMLDAAKGSGDTVFCGWGKHGGHKNRSAWARLAAREHHVDLQCLAVNQDGSPKHPLYVAHAEPLRPYP